MLRHIVARLRGHRAPEAPTPDDLRALGYSAGVARAAIAFLLAEKAAGRLRCYTYLARGGEWGWYVCDEALRDTAKPDAYRRALGDWAHDWITGRSPEGGAR